MLVEFASVQNCGGNQFPSNSLGHFHCDIDTSDAASIEKIVNERTIPHHVIDLPSLSMHCQSLKMPRLDSNEAEDSDFVETLETFIVGRRFHQNIELRHKASLSVLRDSENSNDTHAIKVCLPFA